MDNQKLVPNDSKQTDLISPKVKSVVEACESIYQDITFSPHEHLRYEDIRVKRVSPISV